MYLKDKLETKKESSEYQDTKETTNQNFYEFGGKMGKNYDGATPGRQQANKKKSNKIKL